MKDVLGISQRDGCWISNEPDAAYPIYPGSTPAQTPPFGRKEDLCHVIDVFDDDESSV